MELWIGCVAGALDETEFRNLLDDAGFAGVDVEPTRIYKPEDAATFLAGAGLDSSVAPQIKGRFMSAFVRATKPVEPAAITIPEGSQGLQSLAHQATAPCCGPKCCT